MRKLLYSEINFRILQIECTPADFDSVPSNRDDVSIVVRAPSADKIDMRIKFDGTESSHPWLSGPKRSNACIFYRGGQGTWVRIPAGTFFMHGFFLISMFLKRRGGDFNSLSEVVRNPL